MKTAKIYLLILFSVLLIPFGYTHAQSDWQPDQSLKMEDFEKQALQPKDEVWVVDFWASWCRPCIASLPHMKEMHAKYKDQNVRFVGISWDKKPEKWMRALKRHKMPWQQINAYRGETAFTAQNFPHDGIPSVFVIDRSGAIKKVNNVYKVEKFIKKALNE